MLRLLWVAIVCSVAAADTSAPLDTPITLGTYLGAAGQQVVPSGVAVGQGGGVVIVSGNGGYNFGLTPTTPLGTGGNGTLVMIDVTKKVVTKVIRLGNTADSVSANGKGTVVASGDFGVVALKAESGSLVWHTPWPTVGLRYSEGASVRDSTSPSQAVVGDDGHVGARLGCAWVSFDDAGKHLGNVTMHENACTGVGITAGMLYRTYFHNSNTGHEPIVMPGLVASSYDFKKEIFKDYDYDPHTLRKEGEACNGDVADARAMAVAVGKSGDELYYAGRSDGGDSLYNCVPTGPTAKVTNVGKDKFTQPYNLRANAITWIGKMDAKSGSVAMGQFQLTRLSSGRGNSLQTTSIDVNDDGTMVLGQGSACCIENRANLTINGKPVGPYSGGDGVLMVLSSNFTRLHWTVFNGAATGVKTSTRGVSARGGVAAWVGQSNGEMMLENPLKGTSKNSDGAETGYVALLHL